MSKKYIHYICLLFFLLAGCGGQKNKEAEIYDVQVTSKQVFSSVEEENYLFLGTQYYLSERIQLWWQNDPFKKLGDVYLHREDGSRQLLLQGVDSERLSGARGWLDEEGNCFLFSDNEWSAWDASGKEKFCIAAESDVYAVCQLQNGQTAVVIEEEGDRKLAFLDRQTSRLDIKCSIDYAAVLMADCESGVLFLDYSGLYELNPKDGSRKYYVRFEGTTCTLNVRWAEAIRLLDEKCVEILYSDGHVEQLEYVSVETNKKVLTIRSSYFSSWMKKQIVLFNQTNPEYYVIMDEKPADMSVQDFRQQTMIELSTGRGADLIGSDAVNEADSLLEKGTFADLSPYIENSDIRAEDYFPYTFSYWERAGKKYGVNFLLHPRTIWMREDFSGDEEMLFDMLLAGLKAYPEKAVFAEGYSALDVTGYLLQASDSLWGMVDWERGTCDFSGEVFADIVKVAEDYGDSASNDNPALTGYAVCDRASAYLIDSYVFPKEGKVRGGYLFDDGCHAWLIQDMIAINADSSNKEGAWAFLSFLLQEDVQATLEYEGETVALPSNRKAFETILKHAEENALSLLIPTLEEKGMLDPGLTEEEWAADIEAGLGEYITELYELAENAEPFPMRTEPILEIIEEELQDYFDGSKSYEEIIGVIENRVQLYLDEKTPGGFSSAGSFFVVK